MTENVSAGVVEKLLALLSQDVLIILAFMLIGLVYSIAWTEFRKPAIRRLGYTVGPRRRRIRREAFWAACLPTTLLMAVFLDSTPRAVVSVIVIAAPLTGMLSPLAYDIWRDRLWPRVKGRR